MQTLVVYDSLYGNTTEVAKAIGRSITCDVRVLSAGEVSPSDLESLDLLIAGAPTQGAKPPPPMQAFLNELPKTAVEGIRVAAFDTRMTTKWLKIFGYAAGKITKNLKKKGSVAVLSAEAFYVTSGKGPLKEGELEHAAEWAMKLSEVCG